LVLEIETHDHHRIGQILAGVVFAGATEEEDIDATSLGAFEREGLIAVGRHVRGLGVK
jgi:hypothetical protein